MDYRKLLFDNWGIKLVSLGLSLTLWFYVTSKGKTEMTLTVPLELRNIPQGMTVVGDVAGSLEMRVHHPAVLSHLARKRSRDPKSIPSGGPS